MSLKHGGVRIPSDANENRTLSRFAWNGFEPRTYWSNDSRSPNWATYAFLHCSPRVWTQYKEKRNMLYNPTHSKLVWKLGRQRAVPYFEKNHLPNFFGLLVLKRHAVYWHYYSSFHTDFGCETPWYVEKKNNERGLGDRWVSYLGTLRPCAVKSNLKIHS